MNRLLYSREGTSHDAAVDFEERRVPVRERVFAVIERAGRDGVTDDEIALILDIGLNTARPRRYELEAEGRVHDSGNRRKTQMGRNAIVWVVVIEPKQLAMI